MFSWPAKSRLDQRFASSMRVPDGWTRLEVLLVLWMILVIIAIVLPAVLYAREESRRNRCMGNLKQIGTAVANYNEINGCFPSGFDVSSDGNYQGWGWNLRLLPYLNAADVYDKLKPNLAAGMPGLRKASEFKQRLPLFLCPSDSGAETIPSAMLVTSKVINGIVSQGTEDWKDQLPRSNYFGNVGYLQLEVGGIQYNSAGIPTSTKPLINKGSLGHFGTRYSAEHRYCDQKNFGGYFGQNSDVKVEQIHDGTSNTFVFGERYSPESASAEVVGFGTWIGVPDCTRAQGLAMVLADASVRINIGMPLREQTTGFGSLHHGGAFFTIGDGSVRFISQEIDVVVFRNLSVIDDGSR